MERSEDKQKDWMDGGEVEQREGREGQGKKVKGMGVGGGREGKKRGVRKNSKLYNS